MGQIKNKTRFSFFLLNILSADCDMLTDGNVASLLAALFIFAVLQQRETDSSFVFYNITSISPQRDGPKCPLAASIKTTTALKLEKYAADRRTNSRPLLLSLDPLGTYNFRLQTLTFDLQQTFIKSSTAVTILCSLI